MIYKEFLKPTSKDRRITQNNVLDDSPPSDTNVLMRPSAQELSSGLPMTLICWSFHHPEASIKTLIPKGTEEGFSGKTNLILLSSGYLYLLKSHNVEPSGKTVASISQNKLSPNKFTTVQVRTKTVCIVQGSTKTLRQNTCTSRRPYLPFRYGCQNNLSLHQIKSTRHLLHSR